jgi:hypothetical protein
VIDIGHVERVAVERPDRRTLVDVDVLDPELEAELEVRLGRVVGECPAARLAAPFSGVELDPLEVVGLVELTQLVEPGLTGARVEGSVDDELPGVVGGAASCCVVLNPPGKNSVRYVGCMIALST